MQGNNFILNICHYGNSKRELMQTETMAITGMREDLPMTSKLQDNPGIGSYDLVIFLDAVTPTMALLPGQRLRLSM